MGIASDWARIKGNINAALAAIADKGVTVPSGSTSDALAELIAAIEAGGGASVFAKVTKGSVTVGIVNKTTLTIEHGLGQKPDIAILYNPNGFTQDGITACIMLSVGDFANAGYKNSNSASSRRGVYFGTNASMDRNSFTVQGKLYYGNSTSASSVYFESGDSYEWIAGVYA